MSHSLGVKGREGRVRVGYQTAAVLGTFTLTPDTLGVWRIEASVMSTDAFWLAHQGSRVVELSVGRQRWRWRDAAVVFDGATVHGTLVGRPERRNP
jgi:hypothetical protein